jgi:hypothetical protein
MPPKLPAESVNINRHYHSAMSMKQ